MTTLTTKYKPYPAYRPSGVEWLGDVPAHWEVKRLGVTVQSSQNGVWGAEPNGENDIACARVADFDRIRLQADMGKPTFRSIESGVIQTHLLYPGDLLLEGSGGGEKQPVGAVVLFDSEKPAVCSNFIAQLRPSNGFESRFLTYLHFTLYSARVNVRSIKQSTGIQNLDKASYLNEAVALPSLPEQRSIAAFLDRETARIDELVSREKRLIELLQEKRTALITRAVTRGLDSDAPMQDSGVEWLGEIPAHWEVKPLMRVVTFQRGHDLPSDLREEGDVPVISSSGVFATHSKAIARAPGVVTGRYGTIGNFYLVNEDYWPLNTTLYSINLHGNEPRFLQYTLTHMSPLFLLHAHKAAIPGVDRNDIHELHTAVPPIIEQHVIANYLTQETERLDSLIARVREAIERIGELRLALISAAVTGRIDVREGAG